MPAAVSTPTTDHDPRARRPAGDGPGQHEQRLGADDHRGEPGLGGLRADDEPDREQQREAGDRDRERRGAPAPRRRGAPSPRPPPRAGRSGRSGRHRSAARTAPRGSGYRSSPLSTPRSCHDGQFALHPRPFGRCHQPDDRTALASEGHGTVERDERPNGRMSRGRGSQLLSMANRHNVNIG